MTNAPRLQSIGAELEVPKLHARWSTVTPALMAPSAGGSDAGTKQAIRPVACGRANPPRNRALVRVSGSLPRSTWEATQHERCLLCRRERSEQGRQAGGNPPRIRTEREAVGQ